MIKTRYMSTRFKLVGGISKSTYDTKRRNMLKYAEEQKIQSKVALHYPTN